jgi:hypothetical protein
MSGKISPWQQLIIDIQQLNMKKFTLVLFLVAAAFTAKAQNQPADKGITMLTEFYKAYISVSSNEQMDLKVMEAKLTALRRNNLTKACQKQFTELIEETDGDPIIKAQDTYKELLKTLVIKKDVKKSNRYLVTYTDIAGSRQKTTIYVTLAMQGNNLKIAYLE